MSRSKRTEGKLTNTADQADQADEADQANNEFDQVVDELADQLTMPTAGPAPTREIRRPQWRQPVRTGFQLPTRTKQFPKEETDINAIMKRWHSTGQIDHLTRANPSYGDFSDASDYHSALTRVRAAQDDFARLPAHVRDHVGNDPQEFLVMMYDPTRRDEVEELGLLAHADQVNAETPHRPPTSPPPEEPAQANPGPQAPPSKPAEGE